MVLIRLIVVLLELDGGVTCLAGVPHLISQNTLYFSN